MIRIGFVGVGNWAQQLQEVFMESLKVLRGGGYYRKSPEPSEKFGGNAWRYLDWKELAHENDLIIAAADPKTTTEVALYCAENCIPCVATKPLLEHPQLIGAPFYVDFWRHWSQPYRVFKSSVIGPVSCEIDFLGCGPYRETHDGLDDWGPHAFAYLYDLLGARVETLEKPVAVEWTAPSNPERTFMFSDKGDTWQISGKIGDVRISVFTGNGAKEKPYKQIRVKDWYNTHTLYEQDGVIEYVRMGMERGSRLVSTKQTALRSFAQTVVRSVEAYRDGTDWDPTTNVQISIEASKLIALTRKLSAPTQN